MHCTRTTNGTIYRRFGQWADEASMDMLTSLLSNTSMKNIMFICAYRSNEAGEEHSFAKLMESVTKSRVGSVESVEASAKGDSQSPRTVVMEGDDTKSDNEASAKSSESSVPSKTVEKMVLFSLSPDAITRFIADCIKKEDVEEVSELSEVVYQKTMGKACTKDMFT